MESVGKSGEVDHAPSDDDRDEDHDNDHDDDHDKLFFLFSAQTFPGLGLKVKSGLGGLSSNSTHFHGLAWDSVRDPWFVW